jgi:hypothetical protein
MRNLSINANIVILRNKKKVPHLNATPFLIILFANSVEAELIPASLMQSKQFSMRMPYAKPA